MAFEELKKELEERRSLMHSRLASIKRDVTQGHSGDSAEQAQERENDEVVDAIGNETRQSLHDIQVALDKIAEGTYGECEKCGGEIGEGRLKAIPEAALCVNCADA
ncbi:TraR/DksA family transcriptional regulator [Pseudohalioglobus sediminis]|uniref:TraR/DksA family transcriptional regulator n=1 Tax=Pseudohalioglobus sediminis TaxID=2606449 RepID=A0A5B0WP19_9GAMM|nr:TraR/DksA family transcriptional regulator [Pseudohalioglobus sediminis]KAA1188516.1 TraR/DksA family transcriptional regulator [Pseudohalioglobus sediminis]